MKQIIRSPLFHTSLGVLGLLVSSLSHAVPPIRSCHYYSGNEAAATISRTGELSGIVGEDVFSDRAESTLVVGDMSTQGVKIECSLTKGLHRGVGYVNNLTPVPELGRGFYKTNHESIALRVGFTNIAGGSINTVVDNWSVDSSSSLNRGDFTPKIHLVFQLGIFGYLPPGRYTVDLAPFEIKDRYGVESNAGSDTRDGVLALWFRPTAPLTLVIETASCDLNTKDIQADLGVVSPEEIPKTINVGKPIELTCERGVNIDYKFTTTGSTGVIDNNTLLLDETIANSAKGIGIQIIGDKDVPLYFDTYYRVTPTTTAGQNVQIPFSARYVKVGDDPVQTGKVHSVATFEVHYH